ncbi:hypothetical protein HUU05_11495, partial [candidate division KSB1 bacterium]|nr:hypothetical protein [candidate division KSB1 bacterium]
FPQDAPVLQPRYGKFDSEALAPGPPPVMIDSTLVLLYNAEDMNGNRSCGLARFAMENPTEVLARLESPLFAPAQTEDQKKSFITSGLVWFRSQYELFYGGPATAISRARGKLLFVESK